MTAAIGLLRKSPGGAFEMGYSINGGPQVGALESVSQASEPTRRSRHASRGRHGRHGRQGRRLRAKHVAALVGLLLAGSAAYAGTNWVVGLVGGSSGESQSGTISNLSISAVASPAASNLLYPGGDGDVVVTISNPNLYPVTVTAIQLPTDTTFATGYTSSALSTAQTGCTASTPSDVIWNYSTATDGTSHTLTTPITVGASGQADNPLTITFTDDATMTSSAPAACADTYFSMPSLDGVTASASNDTPTTSPATDSWTS